MDMASTNTSPASPARTKQPKKRNSDVRKEQNRIASRAYREKRKQKLALLDEILKSDSQTDSMSSVSDETDGYNGSGSWTFQDRQASGSPIPGALQVPPSVAQWAAASPSLSSSVPNYTHDAYEGWMSSFSRPEHTFPINNEFAQSFIPTEVGDNSLGHSVPFSMQSLTSAATSTPSVPSIPLDPSLVTNNFAPQHRHNQLAQNRNVITSPNPVYNNDEAQRRLWVASLEDDVLTELERFAGFNHVQQQQILAMIQKRRNLGQHGPSHRSREFRYQTCQATPPPTAQFVNTDFRKYQSMRQASGSPIPSGRR
ncbi:uncharacterized protein F4812DRAFT_306987 [Daldinia caldariorum]|uniref:uncharacterized protein n=1 Tax=Daldinia caldariorum TaxID=326644 RepID=UPI002007802D|nr:uncharacterized protein F4812DRAFT_306987 [Daldinia caldariorum]KAI1469925.1 hypothetical protein F4812DRAFT_306987 [Daldinia caldariorum]